ncbi:GGDEF domain-containing protein [Parasphingorhabdus sp.]|uniref:GGDEF domain-containing protein n=1 Tax=Parasphingorhabdus sp. TaxID=2709688 RepID=UPI003A907A7E
MSDNPGFHIQTAIILAVFAFVFGVLYFVNRKQWFSGWIAIAYACAFVGYIIDSTRTSSTAIGFIFVSTSMFWIFCLGIVKAIYVRCEAAFPKIAALLILILAAVYFSLLTLIDSDISMRSIVVNVTAGALLALALPPLWKSRKQLVDATLFVVIAAVAATFIARVVVVYSVLDHTLTSHGYAESTYAWIFHFSSAICALALAIVLLLAAGHDTVQHFYTKSNLDPMTGLLNRRGLEGLFEARKVRKQGVVYARSIIMFDVDHFKQINDRYGHAAGDKILQRIAKTATLLCQEYGHVARTGGEEFAILTKWLPVETAEFLSQHICDSLGLIVHPELEANQKVTASFGLAILADTDSLFVAMDRADEAMYHAKRNGRNQVALAKAA